MNHTVADQLGSVPPLTTQRQRTSLSNSTTTRGISPTPTMTTVKTYPDGYWLPPGTMPPDLDDVQYDPAELDRKRGTPEYHLALPIKGAEWTNRRQWGTRHGPAVCHGGFQYRHYAENVLLPSGLRGDALAGVRGWRRPDGDGRLSWDRRLRLDVTWTGGVVEFSEDDAVFFDVPSPRDTYHLYLSFEVALARDILGNRTMCALVKDLVGVAAMWTLYLQSNKWQREGVEGVQFFGSDDSIRGLIADMRGRGEDHVDIDIAHDPLYWPFGAPVEERAQILRQMLEEMGWRGSPKSARF